MSMDRQNDSRHLSPRRDHRSREWSDQRSHDPGTRRRDSRSRSPGYKRAWTSSSHYDRRSEEPDRRHRSSRSHRSSQKHREHGRHASETPINLDLPFSARALRKADLAAFEPLFARYLDLQKQKDIDDMDDREVKGRWKSFVGKWNRCELAEGWYDPEMFARAKESGAGRSQAKHDNIDYKIDNEDDYKGDVNKEDKRKGGDEDEEDDYGPVLPASDLSRRAGPSIPTIQDLSLRTELNEEDRQASISDLRTARKADRTLQKERLDELVPRAEPGTRERKLEKKQLVNDKMRSFREKSPGMEAGDERELMGGGDSLAEYKQTKEREQRRKTEREIRREEIERAKHEEMEERRRAWREREEGTVSMLRELARQRFG